MKDVFAIASLVLSLGASVPYIIDIFKGKVIPERISYLLWSALAVTYFASALMTHGSVLFTIGGLIGPGLIFLISLKYGVGGKSWFDRIYLGVAAVAFVLLLVVDNPMLGLLMAVFVDCIGAMLTIRKLLKNRASETRLAWGMYIVAAILAVAGLTEYSAENLLFPAYTIVSCSIIFFIIAPQKSPKRALKEIEKL